MRMCSSFLALSTARPDPEMCTNFHIMSCSNVVVSEIEMRALDFFSNCLIYEPRLPIIQPTLYSGKGSDW